MHIEWFFWLPHSFKNRYKTFKRDTIKSVPVFDCGWPGRCLIIHQPEVFFLDIALFFPIIVVDFYSVWFENKIFWFLLAGDDFVLISLVCRLVCEGVSLHNNLFCSCFFASLKSRCKVEMEMDFAAWQFSLYWSQLAKRQLRDANFPFARDEAMWLWPVIYQMLVWFINITFF